MRQESMSIGTTMRSCSLSYLPNPANENLILGKLQKKKNDVAIVLTCRCGEMADAADSKSALSNKVLVRVQSSASSTFLDLFSKITYLFRERGAYENFIVILWYGCKRRDVFCPK